MINEKNKAVEHWQGTGAGAIHAERPFFAVNCAAIAPELFGSEFFGHTRGLSPERTKTVAEGGTIFLDQVVSG